MIEARPIKEYRELFQFVEICCEPSVFEGMTDDFIDMFEWRAALYNKATRADTVYVGLYLDGEMVGIVMHTMIQHFVWDFHPAILPEYRGEMSRKLMASWKQWLQEQPVVALLAFRPDPENSVSLGRFLTDIGFINTQMRIPAAHIKNRTCHDLEMWIYPNKKGG